MRFVIRKQVLSQLGKKCGYGRYPLCFGPARISPERLPNQCLRGDTERTVERSLLSGLLLSRCLLRILGFTNFCAGSLIFA